MGTEHNDKTERILIIDDEEIVHVSLKRILGRQGFEVESVMAATEGIERISDKRFDLVITDLMMPKMNGIELLEELSNIGSTVPVLMVTGYPSINTALQAMRLGAVDYLPKPFTREELLAPVRRALRKSRGDRGRARTGLGNDSGEGPYAPPTLMSAGDRAHLREHSWAVYRQDGCMDIGVEANFLDSISTVDFIGLPGEGELVEQGHPGIRLRVGPHEEHSVFIPLSGQVHKINHDAVAAPEKLDSQTWLIRIVPSHLHTEMKALISS